MAPIQNNEKYFAAKVRDLARAIMYNDHDSAEILLQEIPKLRYTSIDNYGSTPSHFVCYCQNSDARMAEICLGSQNVLLLDSNHNSPLNVACFTGRTDLVHFFVARDYFVNFISNSGSTALHYAAYLNDINLINALISKGANPHLSDYNGLSSTLIAFQQGYLDTYYFLKDLTVESDVDLIIERPAPPVKTNNNLAVKQEEIGLKVESDTTPIFAESNSVILERVNNLDPLPTPIIENTQSIQEVRKTRKKVGKVLESMIREIEQIFEDEEKAKKSLINKVAALAKEQVEDAVDSVVGFVENLEKQAQITATKNENQRQKDIKKQKKRLSALDKNNSDNDNDNIEEDSLFDILKMITRKLNVKIDLGSENKVKINSKSKKDGDGLIHHLITSYNEDNHQQFLDAIAMLVRCGADINLQNDKGNTPLFLAYSTSSEKLAEDLINLGANINLQNNDGHTPLFLACIIGSEKLVKDLINLGADLTIKDKKMSSVLHYAVANNHIEVVKTLLEHNKSTEIINAANQDGNTAYHYACGRGHEKLANLLLENGVDFTLINNKKQNGIMLIPDVDMKKKLVIKQLEIQKKPSSTLSSGNITNIVKPEKNISM